MRRGQQQFLNVGVLHAAVDHAPPAEVLDQPADFEKRHLAIPASEPKSRLLTRFGLGKQAEPRRRDGQIAQSEPPNVSKWLTCPTRSRSGL